MRAPNTQGRGKWMAVVWMALVAAGLNGCALQPGGATPSSPSALPNDGLATPGLDPSNFIAQKVAPETETKPSSALGELGKDGSFDPSYDDQDPTQNGEYGAREAYGYAEGKAGRFNPFYDESDATKDAAFATEDTACNPSKLGTGGCYGPS